MKSTKNRKKSSKCQKCANPVFMRFNRNISPPENKKIKKNQKKLKKVVDIWEGWCYYNQVAAIRQRQKLKETQQSLSSLRTEL